MSDPDLSVLIVNWNTRAFLKQCLGALPADELPLQIIVVDNASTDGSVEMVRSEFPHVALLASEANLGFAAGNNLAAQQACGRYLFLLNPDTVVARGNLTTLVEFADAHPRGGALGPELVSADGSHQRSCWRGEPGLGMAFADALYLWRLPLVGASLGAEYRATELTQPCKVDHLLGACLMIRRETWHQVGALDERYFLFLEETDWCARARHAGWQLYYVPTARVTHFGQESMRQAPEKNLPRYYKSYLQYYRAHHSGALGVAALKGITRLACLVRIGLWNWRGRQAKDSPEARLAQRMQAGYRQTLRELNTF